MGSPEEFAAVIKADILKLGKVIKEAGLRRDWYTLSVLRASVGVFGKGCVMKRALDKVFFAALSLIPLTAFAQGVLYPTKSVRIVTAGVGGSNDIAARLVAQGLSVTFGQPVIVDNQKDARCGCCIFCAIRWHGMWRGISRRSRRRCARPT